MIGVKEMKEQFKLYSNQNGLAMVEFALVIPMLLILTLTGYNYIRDMELNMLRRDFSRSLSLAYNCSYKQDPTVIQSCYEDVVRNLNGYARTKYILADKNTKAPGFFKFSIHTYAIKDFIAASGTRQTCPSGSIGDLKINYVGGYTTPGFVNPQYSKVEVEKNQTGSGINIKSLFAKGGSCTTNACDTASRVLCQNGAITVGEVYFELDKFFLFGLDKSKRKFYEVSFI